MKRGLSALTVLAICVGSTFVAAGVQAAGAVAEMKGPDGTAMGTVSFTQTAQGVLIQARMTGLLAGPHGFHIHETGACAPDFKAAGGHFNPHGGQHGFARAGQSHAGDLPNLLAHADGTALADTLNTFVSLEAGAAGSLLDSDGSSIIIHAGPDSYGDTASAGGRVACGVIKAN